MRSKLHQQTNAQRLMTGTGGFVQTSFSRVTIAAPTEQPAEQIIE
jgi:hypothetical protein